MKKALEVTTCQVLSAHYLAAPCSANNAKQTTNKFDAFLPPANHYSLSSTQILFSDYLQHREIMTAKFHRCVSNSLNYHDQPMSEKLQPESSA